MSTKPNIYQKISAIMSEVEYLKRESAGQGTGVSFDEAISVIRGYLVKQGIVVTAEKYGESRSRKNTNGSYIFECDYKISYIDIDNPQDRIETVVEAHAMDPSDKAPGKAITYATKISMLKVLSIETGINDESREEVKAKQGISVEQASQLAAYCWYKDEAGNNQWSDIGNKVLAAYNITGLDQIPVKKFDEVLAKCRKLGARNENNS